MVLCQVTLTQFQDDSRLERLIIRWLRLFADGGPLIRFQVYLFV